VLEVFWPTTGVTQTWTNVPADEAIRIMEGESSYSPMPLRLIKLGRSKPGHAH
jgi:hypothetical protein